MTIIRIAQISFLLIAIFIASLQYFAHMVRMESSQLTSGDFVNKVSIEERGIVVPTGSGGRIEAGVQLMLTGQAERLLISGIGKNVNKTDIIKIVIKDDQSKAGELSTLLKCCVDLGPDANNTKDNAVEALAWAKKYNFKTIILVTSDFHLPRATKIFKEGLPDYDVIPYSVSTPWLALDEKNRSSWWHSLKRMSILSAEMLKYWLAIIGS